MNSNSYQSLSFNINSNRIESGKISTRFDAERWFKAPGRLGHPGHPTVIGSKLTTERRKTALPTIATFLSNQRPWAVDLVDDGDSDKRHAVTSVPWLGT